MGASLAITSSTIASSKSLPNPIPKAIAVVLCGNCVSCINANGKGVANSPTIVTNPAPNRKAELALKIPAPSF